MKSNIKLPVPGLHSSDSSGDNSNNDDDNDSNSSDSSVGYRPRPAKMRFTNCPPPTNLFHPVITNSSDSPIIMQENKKKRPVNNVWGAIMQEHIVNHAITSMNMSSVVRDRDIESYIIEANGDDDTSVRPGTITLNRNRSKKNLRNRRRYHHTKNNSQSNENITNQQLDLNHATPFIEIETQPLVTKIQTKNLHMKVNSSNQSTNNSGASGGESSDGCYSTDIHLDPHDIACSQDIDDDDGISETSGNIPSKSISQKRTHSQTKNVFLTKSSNQPRSSRRSSKRKKNNQSIWFQGKISPSAPAHIIAMTLKNLLREHKGDLVERCVEILGGDICNELYVATMAVEKTGGMLTLDGSRRRTLGGVFFHLVKTSDLVNKEQEKQIFAIEQKERKMLKAKRKHGAKGGGNEKVKTRPSDDGNAMQEESAVIIRETITYDDSLHSETPCPTMDVDWSNEPTAPPPSTQQQQPIVSTSTTPPLGITTTTTTSTTITMDADAEMSSSSTNKEDGELSDDE